RNLNRTNIATRGTRTPLPLGIHVEGAKDQRSVLIAKFEIRQQDEPRLDYVVFHRDADGSSNVHRIHDTTICCTDANRRQAYDICTWCVYRVAPLTTGTHPKPGV